MAMAMLSRSQMALSGITPGSRLNGALYINEVASLTPATIMNENRLAFVMDEMSSVDVDEPLDLAVAELFLSLRHQRKPDRSQMTSDELLTG